MRRLGMTINTRGCQHCGDRFPVAGIHSPAIWCSPRCEKASKARSTAHQEMRAHVVFGRLAAR